MAARERPETESAERSPAVEALFPRPAGGVPARPGETVAGGDGSGSAWLAFARDQLAREDARMGSFDRRAVTIVTGSATVVSLLVAAASLSVKDHAFHIGHDAKLALVISGILFFVAALFAIATAFPYGYEAPDAAAIRDIADEGWSESQSDVERVVTVTLIDAWGELQSVNQWKGRAFLLAVLFEGLAVAGVAVGAAKIFF